MKLKITIVKLFFLLFCFQVSGQDTDSIVNKLAYYMHSLNNFSKYVQEEKVYLHFDNTSYYQGDNIWFKCYVENSDLNGGPRLSKTLYVDLLNPGGEIIDKRILKIEDGQCHGEFSLVRLPFYSGFYEVRAYTKYMLNFGEDAVFSRLLPVFDRPKVEGDFEEKNILNYGMGRYPIVREELKKERKVNLKFFPEGGDFVRGIESQVAFEVTDEYGNPLEITGTVINEKKEEITQFSVTREGRGVFSYTPDNDKRRAVIDYEGRTYQFDMPTALLQGVVLKIDNLSYTDSIEITLQKNKETLDCMIGAAVLGRGKLQDYCIFDVSGDEVVRFKMDKTKLPSGVSQIVLFDVHGEIICDRLIFINQKRELIDIKSKTEKSTYEPHELVEMEFSVTDRSENPVPAAFSLSVKDGMNEIDYKHNIMTHFLLMSEIKGYVRNPSYYFESDDNQRRAELDLLMMVQGWRRHMWGQMARVKPMDFKYLPEQGIETHGQVVSYVRGIPQPKVSVDMLLLKNDEEYNGGFIESFETDSLGRFTFVSDVYDKWYMTLSVKVKGKARDHRIIFDRFFSPNPRKYRYTEMHADAIEEENAVDDEIVEAEMIMDYGAEMDSILMAQRKFAEKLGIDERIHQLREVEVVAKKRSREADILNNRSKSLAYYDVGAELDYMEDQSKFIGNDIHELMINMNENFSRPVSYSVQDSTEESLKYKTKLPLFVINYERTLATEDEYFKYKNLRVEAIKSIYINESLPIICQYADPNMIPFHVASLYGCVVFIETYPNEMIPTEAGKGVRKTKLEGYSSPIKEFYNPDYSVLSPEPDYRRTLYWNPSVTPDEDGKAKILFYNNSTCKNFSISAETITSQGLFGLYKTE